ncbi:1-acyl-sn-glycerol-3-phosphate acyltransferase epsilon [Vipera latastei]
MLLSLVLHTYSMRYVLPAAVMMGTAPTYILAWGAWRLLSTLLPARFYHQVDDRLYTVYQSMVLFFFENYTGVQIILYGDLPKRECLTVLKHVLIPRVKATHVAVDSMKSYLDAVYDVSMDHKGQRKVAASMTESGRKLHENTDICQLTRLSLGQY